MSRLPGLAQKELRCFNLNGRPHIEEIGAVAENGLRDNDRTIDTR